MAPPSAADYHVLAPKFNSEDPDIRYMTLVDLGRLLENTPQVTLSREQAICGMIVDNLIKLLDDTNGDVQNQALKCIKPFTSKAPPDLLIPFMQKVVNLEASKSQDASITSTAARTLVLSLPHPMPGAILSRQVLEAHHAVSQVLLPKILGLPATSKSTTSNRPFINFDTQKGVSIEALDLLSEVVHSYGICMTPAQFSATEACLTRVLNDKNTGPIAKKRAILTLAKLCTWLSDEELSAFVSRIVEDFKQPHLTAQKQRILVSVLGAMARTIPVKFGPYLQTLAPFVLGILTQQEYDETIEAIAEDNYDTARDDLKEAALLTVEDFLTGCRLDMRIFTTEAIEAGLCSLAYDPAVDSNGSDDEMKDDDDELLIDDDDDYEQEEQFDDGDDASWKIRRSAGKMFCALISSRPDLIDSGLFYEKLLPALIKAFKDREESVQLEALSAATMIVRSTAATVSLPTTTTTGAALKADSGVNTRKRRRADSTIGALSEEEQSRGYASPTPNLPSPTSGPKTELLLQGHDLASGAINLLSHTSNQTRQAAIVLLKSFVHLKHDSLVGLLDKVLEPVAGIAASTQGATHSSSGVGAIASGGTLRIEALQLLGVIFDTHSSTTVSPFVDHIIKAIRSSVDDRNLKIAGEALSAAESIIKALTPPRTFGYDRKSKQYIEEMFDVVLGKAKSSDADLEVREKAIQAVGVCIARTADVPDNLSVGKRNNALIFLRERLAGETTRIPATMAIDLILTTDQTGQIDSQWLIGVAAELGQHLKKADRRVRSVGLSAVKKLTSNPAAKKSLNTESVQTLTHLILQLYETDGLTHIVLVTEILSDLVSISPQVVVDGAFNKVIAHMVVQNLGGHTLDSFLELIANVGSAGVGTSLMNALLQDVGVRGDPQVVGATIGTLLASGGSTISIKIDSFISEIQSKSDDRRVALALIVLGEVGSILGNASKITPDIFVQSLKSKSELVQAAAATSLGRSAASNTKVFLPTLLETIQKEASKRTLGLLSIKELLQQTSKSNTNITDYSQQLWDILLKTTSVDESRSLTAECIGRLTAIEPGKYFPLLHDHLNDGQLGTRSAVIQAVRFAVGDSDDASDDALRPYLVKMLVVMLQDSNIENKRLAMATLQSAARNKPRLVLGSLPQLLPFVVKSSVLDPSLIREVQMGPFKHKVDDGLEMRKGAYEALHAFMDLAYPRMNHAELFDRVLAGLQDDHDIKMLVFLMLTKLIIIDRDEVERRLDIIAERFQAILSTKLKENAVKQEVEKLKETIKEVLILTLRLRNEYPDLSSAGGGSTGQVFKSYQDYVKREYGAQLQATENEIRSHA